MSGTDVVVPGRSLGLGSWTFMTRLIQTTEDLDITSVPVP
jgi:hypothetical protein